MRPGFGRRPRCRPGGSLWRRGISLRRSRRLRPGVLRGPCAPLGFPAEALDLSDDSPTRRKFLARLQGEISKRGAIDVLRYGIKHGPHHIDLFYGTPSPGNPAGERFAANRFSVTRQLRYSRDETQRALDLCFFINGLPVATFELKNSLTQQTVEDAVQQYKRDRNPREAMLTAADARPQSSMTRPWRG